MALVYVGGVSSGRAGSTSQGLTFTITSLSGGAGYAAESGDLVCAAVVIGANVERSVGIATAGFTKVASLYSNANSSDCNLSVSWKIMAASPDTTVVTSPSGSTAHGLAAAVHVWRGTDVNSPFEIITTSLAAGTGRPIPPSIMPVSSGTVILCAGGGAALTGAVFTATSMQYFRSVNGPDNIDGAVGLGSYIWPGVNTATLNQWTGGTTGANDSWAAVALALRPYAEIPQNYEFFPADNAGVSDVLALKKDMIRTLYNTIGASDYISVLQAYQIIREIAESISLADSLSSQQTYEIVRLLAEEVGLTDEEVLNLIVPQEYEYYPGDNLGAADSSLRTMLYVRRPR